MIKHQDPAELIIGFSFPNQCPPKGAECGKEAKLIGFGEAVMNVHACSM